MTKEKSGLIISCLAAGVLLCSPGPLHAQPAEMTARDVLNHVIYMPPVIEDDRVILPESPDDRYEIRIAGSSNEAVITTDGRIISPLETMEVQLLYRVVNKKNSSDSYMSDNLDVTVSVPGRYEKGDKDNARPEVLPGIREWKGLTGSFRLGDKSRILISCQELQETAEVVREYLTHFTGSGLPIVTDEPKKGDILLSLADRDDLGEEGYAIEIGDIVRVEAGTPKGCLYAGTTLSQMISSDPGHDALPKGLIRDYPAYGIRGCMLDVARIYIPLDYVSEMVRYMAYFKINEVQMHINDDGGEQQAAFRVESKRYPEINSGIKASEVWSQEDYRRFQKEMARYGVDVITEIDTPAHSRFVSLHNPDYMLDDSHIRLTNPDALGFIRSLYDEFLDGNDPVFISRNFHIGADEYPRGTRYGDDFMRYLNEMISYVKGKGLNPRMWASIGGGGLCSDIPVENEGVTANYWAYSWADFEKLVRDGFLCLNNSHDLYVVPGRLTAYDDYFSLEKKYYCWETTDLSGNWPLMSPAHPLLAGCQASIWYDKKVGTSQFDYFDRQKDQTVFISEKGWFGARKKGQSSEDFLSRIAEYSADVPGVNPGRNVASKSDVLVSYDFSGRSSETESRGDGRTKAKDLSGNGYDATLDGVRKEGGRLILDGDGAMKLPFASVGFPYTVSMDIFIDPSTPEKAVLFEGADGIMYLNYDGNGSIGYERKGYTYILPYEIPKGEWVNVSIVCDRTTLHLLIDGKKVAQGAYAEDPDGMPDSSTFVMPVESIGSGLKGMIDNFTIRRDIPSIIQPRAK